MSRPSLTSVPTYIFGTCCLSFLNDDDLFRARRTCSIFLQGFYKYFRGSENSLVNYYTGIIDAAKAGHVFPYIVYMNLQLPFESFDFKHINPLNFPALNNLQLNYVCVNSFPTNPNVTCIKLIGCTFYGKKKKKKEKLFPFFNVKVLEIEGGSPLTEDCPLPRLFQLKSLKICDTILTHPITKRKFPRLVALDLRGEDTVQKVPNIRVPKVKKLTLSHPELLSIRRNNLFYFILHLKLYLSTVDIFDDCWIINRLNGISFPRLESLELDYGVDWVDCYLQYLQPQPRLKSLIINSRGSIDLNRVTDERFPSLRTLILNTDEVNLGMLPAHDMIEQIIFPPNTDYSTLLLWRTKNWPRLKSWGYFGHPLETQVLAAEGKKNAESLTVEDDGVLPLDSDVFDEKKISEVVPEEKMIEIDVEEKVAALVDTVDALMIELGGEVADRTPRPVKGNPLTGKRRCDNTSDSRTSKKTRGGDIGQ